MVVNVAKNYRPRPTIYNATRAWTTKDAADFEVYRLTKDTPNKDQFDLFKIGSLRSIDKSTHIEQLNPALNGTVLCSYYCTAPLTSSVTSLRFLSALPPLPHTHSPPQ
jgi:hypothetical protein